MSRTANLNFTQLTNFRNSLRRAGRRSRFCSARSWSQAFGKMKTLSHVGRSRLQAWSIREYAPACQLARFFTSNGSDLQWRSIASIWSVQSDQFQGGWFLALSYSYKTSSISKQGPFKGTNRVAQVRDTRLLLSSLRQEFVQFTIFLLAYCVAGKLGQATTNIRSSNLGPVWPAYGIALAAFLLCAFESGRRLR